MREEVKQFVEQESQITSSTEYEERVLELSKKFAAGLIAKSQGKMPKSRNSKKSLARQYTKNWPDTWHNFNKIQKPIWRAHSGLAKES